MLGCANAGFQGDEIPLDAFFLSCHQNKNAARYRAAFGIMGVELLHRRAAGQQPGDAQAEQGTHGHGDQKVASV